MSTQPDSEQTVVSPIAPELSLQASSIQSKLHSSGIADLSVVDKSRLISVMRLLDEAFRGLQSATVSLGSDTSDEPSPTRIGRFDIRGKLGSGGFATVYRAHDPLLLREVAIKVIPERKRPKLERYRFLEARAVARLSHPNLVPLYEVFEEGGKFCLVSELCDGPTLSQWLNDHPGPVPPKLTVEILLRIIDAVAHAHDSGLIHRDIKPGNILLVPTNVTRDDLPFNPRLTDFGLVRDITAEPDDTDLTTIAGTLQYMAPEQLLTQTDSHGPSCDVFASGVLMYRMLTGKMPHMSDGGIDLLSSICFEPPGSMRTKDSSVSKDLEAITLKCLRKNPRERYGSARDIVEDLRRWREGRPVLARSQAFTERTVRAIQRAPLETSLIAAVIVTMAVSAVMLANRNLQLKRQSEDLAKAVRIAVANTERAGNAERETRIALTEVSEQKKAADENRLHAIKAAYLSDMQLGYAALAVGDYAQIMEITKRIQGYAHEVIPVSIDFKLLCSMGRRNITSLKSHTKPIEEIAIDGKRGELIVGGEEGVLRFHQIENGKLLHEINFGPFVHITALAISPDGNTLAVGKRLTLVGNTLLSFNRIELIELASKHQKTFGDFDATIESLAFSRDGRSLLIGPRYEPIFVYSLESLSESTKIKNTRRNLQLLVGSNSGHLYHIPSHGVIACTDIANNQQVNRLELNVSLDQLALSPDESWLAVTHPNTMTISLIDITAKEWKIAGEFEHNVNTSALGFTQDSTQLITGSPNGSVLYLPLQSLRTLEDGETSKPPKKLVSINKLMLHKGSVDCVAEPSPQRLVSASGDGTLVICSTKKPDYRFNFANIKNSYRMQVSKDAAKLYCGTSDGNVHEIRLASGETRELIPEGEGYCSELTLSPDGKLLAVGWSSGRTALIDLAESDASKQITYFESQTDAEFPIVTRIDFNPTSERWELLRKRILSVSGNSRRIKSLVLRRENVSAGSVHRLRI